MISCRARLVTMDETWLYHYDPETKQQSMERRHSGSPRSKNSEWKNPLEKFWPRIFWDQDGMLFIDYLPKGQMIYAEYYLSLLVQLKDSLKENAAGNLPTRSCSSETMSPLTGHWQPERNWPTWATTLLITNIIFPSVYHLFPGLEKQLKILHFSSDVEVIAAAENWLDGQTFFLVACKFRTSG